MTMQEVSRRYNIPLSVLRDYERWGRCGHEKQGEYDQTDLERLGLIMTLYDVGFTEGEVACYLSEGTSVERQTQLLLQRREWLLEELHLRQTQLDRLDYLRFTLARNSTR